MNKRQLMLDCLNGKPTERVPGSFWFHNQPDVYKRQNKETVPLLPLRPLAGWLSIRCTASHTS